MQVRGIAPVSQVGDDPLREALRTSIRWMVRWMILRPHNVDIQRPGRYRTGRDMFSGALYSSLPIAEKRRAAMESGEILHMAPATGTYECRAPNCTGGTN